MSLEQLNDYENPIEAFQKESSIGNRAGIMAQQKGTGIMNAQN